VRAIRAAAFRRSQEFPCFHYRILDRGILIVGSPFRRPDWKKYLVVAAAFALALMSKPMAVSLPLVLLLLDYWPLELT
jgi:hypothetical protein